MDRSDLKRSRRPVIAVVGLALLLTASALTATAGELTTEWNLNDLYPSIEAWEQAKGEIPGMVDELVTYQGKLGESAATLASALELASNLTKQQAQLYIYASLSSDLDIRKPGPLGRRMELQQMFAGLSAKTSWIDPEILSISDEKLQSFLAAEPRLEPFRRTLERLEKQRPHILDAKSEQIISMASLMEGDGSTIGSLLRNAEIPWKTITLADGTELKVDVNGYSHGRAVANRDDRIKTYDAFYTELTAFEQSLATTLSATVKGHVFNTRVRSYDSTLDASLSDAEVDPAVYHMLIDEVNRALPSLHRYLRLRARMLGVKDLAYYDLYPSLVDQVQAEFPWDRTVDVVLKAFAPMGEEYVSYLRAACEKGWIDVMPAEGKRSGAYVSGNAYDVHPYMLLNHRNDYDSASTFAHESGHMMHSALSNATQPFPTSDYATFVAEVASTTQEWLFFKYSLAHAANDQERLAILGNFLESVRTTVFRQTMFAEFELAMHKLVEDGKPITSEALDTLYLDLLRRYHGHDQGVCTIDKKFAVEWAFIPHFHYDYYVYSYATSFIAATAFHEQILSGENGGVDRYINKLLKAGSSEPPVQILQDAGVDMTTPAPFRATIAAMNEIMDQIEEILARQP